MHVVKPIVAVEGLTPTQEAAVLFSQGHFEQAMALLEDAIREQPARQDAWHLLFTLHRTLCDADRFDALAHRYGEHFDEVAPSWLDQHVVEALPPEMRPGGAAYVELMGELADPDPRRFEALHARCARHAVVHLDGTRINLIDPASATRLSRLLRALADDGTGLFISGAARLAAILREMLDIQPAQASFWTLLLDLFQLQSRAAEFESAALEFALQTGEEQPQWQANVLPVLHLHPVQEKRAEPRYSGPEALALFDVVTSAHDSQLVALQQNAQERQYVNVDLSRLTRITPAAAQTLVSLTNALVARGKVVRLIRPNLLVEGLLTTLSFDARIQLIRAQLG